jgi:hypothetical protein
VIEDEIARRLHSDLKCLEQTVLYVEAFEFYRTVVSGPRTGPWSLQRFDVLRTWTCCVQEPYKTQTVVPATNLFFLF